MIGIQFESLTHLSQPVVITDPAGLIKKMNVAAEHLVKVPLQRVVIIHPLPEIPCFTQNIQWGNISIRADIIKVLHNSEPAFLLFLKNDNGLDIDQVLEQIDAAIVVTDRYGVAIKVTEGFTRLSGVDRYLIIGKDLREAVANKIILHESITIKALQLKRPLKMNVYYQTGRHVTWTSNFIYSQDGEIDYVVSTGRDITELIRLEEELRRTEALKDEYLTKLKELEEFLGEGKMIHASNEMQKILRTSIKAAKSDVPVFIWGESGVGKELIANLIHRLSDRKEMPFIEVNCAAIPSELLESEFFGYEEGAFTGARRGGKKGLFEEANGGIIFLDEVGELPFPMQSKFLRVLQQKQVMRIGGNKAIPINVRIMAATNLSKEQLLDNQKFRQDLFYRLCVIPIHIPPLRERRSDIIPLINLFLDHFNKQYGSDIRFPKNLTTRLYNYDWPGNVRELKNFVERLVILSESGEINENTCELVSVLGTDFKGNDEEISITRLMPLKEAIGKMEEILIRKAYREQGSMAKTAEILKVDPSTLHRKIKKSHMQIKPETAQS
jgi:PAS domain S-box-containing protein